MADLTTLFGNFQPGPEVPTPPLDIPVPDIPRADFVTIGREAKKGEQASGFWEWLLQLILEWIPAAIGKVIGAALGLAEFVIAYFVNIGLRAMKDGEFGSEEITRVAIDGLLKGRHTAESFSILQAAMGAMSAPAPGSGTRTLSPSSEPAEKFLQLSADLSIEAWAFGVLAEVGTVGQLETVGGLKEALAEGLGLGRLARQAFGPPMDILVKQPYTWLLNNMYRPKLASESVAVRQYLRGIIDRTELDRVLGWQGYNNDMIEATINANKLHLSVGQLEALMMHGSISEADALKELKDQGYDDHAATSALFVQHASRVDGWNQQLVNAALTGYSNRQIDQAEFERFVNNSGLSDPEKQILLLLGQLRQQLNTSTFSISQAQDLVLKGLWTLDQFRNLAYSLGWSESDETDLELLLLGKLKDQADAAAAKAATNKAKAEAAAAKALVAKQKAADAAIAALGKGVSVSKYEALVKDGIKTVADYSAFLLSKGIASPNVTALTTELQNGLNAAAAATGTKAAAAATTKAKNLNLAQLEAATMAGLFTLDEYLRRVEASGVSEADAAILGQLLQDKIDTAATRATATADAKAQAAVKHVNLGQAETAVRLGLATLQQYGAFLTAAGYAADDAGLLVAELQTQLAADKAARATKGAIAADLATKGLSLSDLEKAVRAGISTVADYTAALAAAGYTADAQDTLVSLLQLQMQQDQSTLAAKGTAGALLDQRGVSLANLERAVKLGVVPISTYSAALVRAGVNADDANILTLTLTASVKAEKAAQSTGKSVGKQLTAVGLNLAALEKAVLAGKLTMPQFSAQLAGAGVSAADGAAVTGLLQDQLANQAAAAAQVQDATARAAAKGLNLSQETAAVKAGVKSLDDFTTFATSLGYDDADVATLAATLGVALDAAAAAAAKKTAPSDGEGSSADDATAPTG